MTRPSTITGPYGVRSAWIIWAFLFIIIATTVAMRPHRRTVTPAYRTASIKWFAGEDIYGEGIHGYLYLPQACILFAPFEKLPFAVGEVLWRAFCIGVLAAAVWRLSRLAGRGGAVDLFLLMTLLVIPTALDSASDGQMNLPLAAMMAFACVDLGECRWSLAALWLALGLALKPLIIVMLVFAAILYRPMRWRLALAVLAVLAIPFLTQQPSYVWTQYRLFLLKMQAAGNPGDLWMRADGRTLGIAFTELRIEPLDGPTFEHGAGATTVDFKKSSWPGVISSARGLSGAEPWGTWSSSDAVTLEFSEPLPEKFAVHLVAYAFGPNVRKEFVAHVGDSAIRFRLTASPEERVLEFSNPKGSKILKVDVPSPCSPKEIAYNSNIFSDIFGMARALGVIAPFYVQAVVRAIAAALTLAFCWLGLKRRGNEHGSIMFLAFNACYLLLFNPRTENCSYMVAGLPMAVFAARALLWDHRRAIAWLLIALILAMSASYEITRGSNLWLCPGVCLVFLMYVIFLLRVNIQAPSK